MTALLDRPRLTIELEGTSLGAALGRAVSSAQVRRELAAPAESEIDLADPPEDALEGVRHGQALVLLRDMRVEMGELAGRGIATPDEARAILGMPPREVGKRLPAHQSSSR